MRPSPKDLSAWLRTEPSIEEICKAFPKEWTEVQRSIAELVQRGDAEELTQITLVVAHPPSSTRRRARSPSDEHARIMGEIRRQMTAEALRRVRLSAATGVVEGTVRFNSLNGWVLQHLLFEHDLERKPVSLFWYRLLWPLLPQRRYLMTLVAPKGIYCFYSRRLVKALAGLIGNAPCLEIAAGDGTLSRFLAEEGVRITASDNQSWKDRVRISADVLRQDAATALRVHRPTVVICSWPPAKNTFERDVFRTDSVQTYIVISTHAEYSSGDWEAYRQQQGFELSEEPALSRLVLPQELAPAVYIFRRKTSAPDTTT